MQNTRTISLTGDVTGSANFDGSENVSINAKLNIATITGKISLSKGSGSVTLNYPNGYNADNCIPLAVGIDIMAANYYSYYSVNTMQFEARLTGSGIVVKVDSSDGVGTSSSKNVKVVLMKI